MSNAQQRPLAGRIAPSSGTSFLVRSGERLRVIDPEGGQVSDLMAFAAADHTCWLSAGRSFDYEETIRLTTGNSLWSNTSQKMLTILEDSCGVHDFLLTPCSHRMFSLLYELETDHEHPSCLSNLSTALKAHGIQEHQIPTTFNIFMNVPVRSNGSLRVVPPETPAGTFIVLRAEMDLLVALTSCSSEGSNSMPLSAIEYTIESGADRQTD